MTEGFGRLLAWARQRYDRVVVDMPIVMVIPGVVEVSRAGAAALLVHRSGWVPAQVLQQVRDHLGISKVVLAGVVLNAIQQHWAWGRYPLIPYASVPDRTLPDATMPPGRDTSRP
jgi:Mrp family chromosome partitioning ATPase